MSDYLAAYCPPIGVLILLLFLFTLLNPWKRSRHSGRGMGRK